jgi:F-type H+-transporting ATPase subunit gamma
MATLRDIQRRIKAVTSTRQITKAMKMVAAAKLRKAQQRMMEMRSYADRLYTVTSSLATGVEREAHPLLMVRPRKVVQILVLTSDKGLCGAFNTNVLKAANKLANDLQKEVAESVSSENLTVQVSAVGRKARDHYKRRKMELSNQWTGLSGALNYESAQEVARSLIDAYVDENVDEVYVVYNEFINVVQQKVQTVKLLPVEEEICEETGEPCEKADFIYEPAEEEILDRLLPKNIEIQVYRGLLESQASEEAARMTSMENATKAASEMIDGLTLQYNKARQAAITAELMDIVGGVEALKGS